MATINRELATLSHFLIRCATWGWITKRPTIKKPEEKPKEVEALKPQEREALMQAAIGDQDPLTWLFVAIGLGTGMRHSEILRVRWNHINFETQRIHIPRAKAGEREQPIPAALAERLKAEHEQLGKPSGYLFPTARADAKHPHRLSMAEQFRRAVKHAKLDPARVTPHVLRYTAITELVNAGVPLPIVQRISGHKTFKMVLRYTKPDSDKINESLAALDSAFRDAVSPELHTRDGESESDAA